MPKLPIAHFTWQVLRTVKRAKKKYPTGKDLRLVPSRRTKDGTFLDDLVTDGLLEVVGEDPVSDKTKKWPVQFRRRYKLTEKGEFAAEFGECERELRKPE